MLSLFPIASLESLLSWAWISCRYPFSWSPGALRYPQMETTVYLQSRSCASAGNHPSLAPSGSGAGCAGAVPTPPVSHFHPSSPTALESRPTPTSAFPRSATMANSQVQCRSFSYLSTPFPQQEPCVVSDAGKEGSLRADRWS